MGTTDSQQRVTILFRGVGKIIYTPSHELLLFEIFFPHKTQERNLLNEVLFIKIGEGSYKISSYSCEIDLQEKKGKK